MALLRNKIVNFQEINVKNEQELIALVKQINSEIEAANIIKLATEKEKTLDFNYLLKRYRAIKKRVDSKTFREKMIVSIACIMKDQEDVLVKLNVH